MSAVIRPQKFLWFAKPKSNDLHAVLVRYCTCTVKVPVSPGTNYVVRCRTRVGYQETSRTSEIIPNAY
jgi:hypothetical protein